MALERLYMQVFVNGEAFDCSEGARLNDFLTQMGLPLTKIAIELNLSIVPKSTYDTVTLRDQDRLEVVHFIGGG